MRSRRMQVMRWKMMVMGGCLLMVWMRSKRMQVMGGGVMMKYRMGVAMMMEMGPMMTARMMSITMKEMLLMKMMMGCVLVEERMTRRMRIMCAREIIGEEIVGRISKD